MKTNSNITVKAPDLKLSHILRVDREQEYARAKIAYGKLKVAPFLADIPQYHVATLAARKRLVERWKELRAPSINAVRLHLKKSRLAYYEICYKVSDGVTTIEVFDEQKIPEAVDMLIQLHKRRFHKQSSKRVLSKLGNWQYIPVLQGADILPARQVTVPKHARGECVTCGESDRPLIRVGKSLHLCSDCKDHSYLAE